MKTKGNFYRAAGVVFVLFFALSLTRMACIFVFSARVNATPFYDLQPEKLVFRAEFSTFYQTSTEERKHNIALAVKSLDKTLVEAGGEFSFNHTVGERTEKRGYKSAKIISGGKFVDGVGGGVCQVSTTLYNAALLSGLKITEYHPHSLAISYIEPSFDAMVNSSYADLKFINSTKNPVVIYATCDGSKITVKIWGEKMRESYERESKKTGVIPIPEDLILKDDRGEYPYLNAGERELLSYGKAGLKSEGYLIKKINGKKIYRKNIRNDTYKALPNVLIEGAAKIKDAI